MITIDCISDLHGFYPKLAGGDLLIVAGDLTKRDEPDERLQFLEWLANQKYQRKIFIAGNHDNSLTALKFRKKRDNGVDYLCDSGCEIFYQDDNPKQMNQSCLDFEDVKQPNLRSLKVWGSPWTKTFPGMNQACKAFTVDTDEELAEKFSLIPQDVDILITHSPPYGILDTNVEGKKCGSKSLYEKLKEIKPLLHIFGHIHEQGYKYSLIKYPIEVEQFPSDGIQVRIRETHCVNASHVNERYQPVNKPIRIILGERSVSQAEENVKDSLSKAYYLPM